MDRIMKTFQTTGLVCLLMLALACQADPQQQQLFNVLSGKDRIPPVFLGAKAVASDTIICYFNEPVSCDLTNTVIGQGLGLVEVRSQAQEIKLVVDGTVAPGVSVVISARVRDLMGNSLGFSTTCWGKNERIPQVLINEFTTKGSGNNPDRVELWVATAGNLAGVTFYDGMPDSYESTFTFTALEVLPGDSLVLYFGQSPPEGKPNSFEASEVGLGSNNGVLSLYATPGSDCLDAALYSNRTSTSDSTFHGFGTQKVLDRVLLLQKHGGWGDGIGIDLTPEMAIDSTYSTATRSMGRQPNGADTDTNLDWRVAATGKASFGARNSTEVHVP